MAEKKFKSLQSVLIKFYHQPVAKVSAELFLSVAAIIFFAVFAIKPTLVTMSDLLKEIEDKRKLDEQMERKAAALSTAQGEYQALRDKFYLLDEALPSMGPELIKSLKIVEKIAADNNIIIRSLSLAEIPDESRTESPVDSLQVSNLEAHLEILGSYPDIKNFVTDCYQSRRIFSIDSISFQIEEGEKLETLKSIMTLKMPYLTTEEAQAEGSDQSDE